MGLAEAVALILALFIPTTLFIVGYYFFARSVDPFRKKEKQVAQPLNFKIDAGSSAEQIADVESKVLRLHKKGQRLAAYELYKQAYGVKYHEAETAVEALLANR